MSALRIPTGFWLVLDMLYVTRYLPIGRYLNEEILSHETKKDPFRKPLLDEILAPQEIVAKAAGRRQDNVRIESAIRPYWP